MSTFSDQLGTSATAVTITAGTLASSATVGRQSNAITLLDANKNVPIAIDVDLSLTIAATAPANDKAIYLYAARSIDGTNYEAGPPAVGTTDAAYTFANSPVGTTPLPPDMLFLGAITVNAASESHRKVFRLVAPPPNLVLVVLNYSGAALTACAIQYRSRFGDGR